jgi:hypothetical protein
VRMGGRGVEKEEKETVVWWLRWLRWLRMFWAQEVPVCSGSVSEVHTMGRATRMEGD